MIRFLFLIILLGFLDANCQSKEQAEIARIKKNMAKMERDMKMSKTFWDQRYCGYIDTCDYEVKCDITLDIDTIVERNPNTTYNEEFKQYVVEDLKYPVLSYDIVKGTSNRKYFIKNGYFEHSFEKKTITKFIDGKKIVFQECK